MKGKNSHFLLNEIVFTTTDSVGLKKGDVYWYLSYRHIIGRPQIRLATVESYQDLPKGQFQFSTWDFATEYLAKYRDR